MTVLLAPVLYHGLPTGKRPIAHPARIPVLTPDGFRIDRIDNYDGDFARRDPREPRKTETKERYEYPRT